MTKIDLNIIYNDGVGSESYYFVGIIHKAESVDKLKLDSIGFYQKYNKVPDFPHFEIEIENDTYDFICVNKYFKMVHIHPAKEENKKSFICWTNRIETFENAVEVFRLWSLGTVYTMNKGEGFAELFYKCKNAQEFEVVMRENGVTVL